MLAIYEKNGKGDFKTLMFEMKDNAGNNPFAFGVKETINVEKLHKWIIHRFGDDLDSKLKLLFSENKDKEVPLIEGYPAYTYLKFVNDYIYEYFTKIRVVNEANAEFAGRALFLFAEIW